jgi:hypothetical protein
MAEYPAHLEEIGWTQDGGISSSPGGNWLDPRWRNIQLTWIKWAGHKMADYDTNLEKMVAADLKRQRIKSASR